MTTDRGFVAALEELPLFSGCSRDEPAQIAAAASTLSFPAGTVLARAGDVGREFMLIVDGTADVEVNGAVVNRIGPGDAFGEVALLDGGLRTATADVVAHVIEQREFSVLVYDSPSIARKLLVGLAKRLRAIEQRLTDPDQSVR